MIRQESDLNGASIAFPQPLSLTAEHLKELDKESTFEAFMRKHGGADVGLKLTQIVLTGNRKEPVRILDIRAINQCGPVLTGTLFASPPAGGDDTIRLGFDLDRENPRAKLMVGDKVKSKGSYFNTKTISLRSKEQQPFQILAWTSDSYCEFRLELTVLAGREIETQLIRDGTEPFKVTALTKRARDTLSRTPFADYQKVYIGRILHGRQEVGFIEVDPSTWE